jgi:hypothetical protein
MSKIKGYLVFLHYGGAYENLDREPTTLDAQGVLWPAIYTDVTMFESRARAKRAVRKSLEWGKAQGLPWQEGEYRIVTVRGEEK